MAEKERAAKAKQQKVTDGTGGTMSVLEHLSELKKCLFIIVGTFLGVTLVSYYFAPKFVRVCLNLAPGYNFVTTTPQELLGQYVRVSIIVGIVFAVPVFVWQANRFASPGLKKNEDRLFLGVMLSAIFFFLVGAVFCWLVVIPFMLQFFLSLNTIDVEGMYGVKEYLTYIVGVIVAFGIIFEIPVVASILALIGLLKPDPMIAARRVEIVVCFVVGAAITPTDVMSQLLVAIPMCLLYEVAILLVRVIYKARLKRHPDEVEEEEAEQEKIRQERKSRWERAAAAAEKQNQTKNK